LLLENILSYRTKLAEKTSEEFVIAAKFPVLLDAEFLESEGQKDVVRCDCDHLLSVN
jgi:hypothetical protein